MNVILTTAEWAMVSIALQDYQERVRENLELTTEVSVLRHRLKRAGAREWTLEEKAKAAAGRRRKLLAGSAP